MSGLLNRVLFATDLSDEPAQAYALFLASAFRAELHLVYVLEIQPSLYPEGVAPGLYIDRLHAEFNVELNDLVRRMAQQAVRVQATQLLGPAAEGILEFSKEYEADLIVLGSHGRFGLDHLLTGGIGDRVLKSAPCPVVLIPSHEQHRLNRGIEITSPPRLRHLLVPVDFSDCSIEACEYAIQLALPFHASLTLLHVREGTGVYDEAAAGHQVEERLQDLINLVQALDLPAQYRLCDGDAGKVIIRAVEEESCDMIVMGAHPRFNLSKLFSRTVTQTVLRHPPCPVLVVRSPKFRPGHRRLPITTTSAP